MDLIDTEINNNIWFYQSPKGPAAALKPIVDWHRPGSEQGAHSFLERYASPVYMLRATALEMDGFD